MHASRCIHHTAARTAFASTNTVFHYIWGRGVLSGVLGGSHGVTDARAEWHTPANAQKRPNHRFHLFSSWARTVRPSVFRILVPGKCTPGLAHGMPGSFWTFLGPHAGVCGDSACGNRKPRLKIFDKKNPMPVTENVDFQIHRSPSITTTNLDLNFEYDT